MVDIRWWSSLTCQLNTKPRNAKNTLKLAIVHTARGVSSSMALRTNLFHKLFLPDKPLSLRTTKAQWSVWLPCSSLLQVLETKRPSEEKVLLSWKAKCKKCFLKQAFTTWSTSLQHARMWSVSLRKALSQRTRRYRFNLSQELPTVRC